MSDFLIGVVCGMSGTIAIVGFAYLWRDYRERRGIARAWHARRAAADTKIGRGDEGSQPEISSFPHRRGGGVDVEGLESANPRPVAPPLDPAIDVLECAIVEETRRYAPNLERLGGLRRASAALRGVIELDRYYALIAAGRHDKPGPRPN